MVAGESWPQWSVALPAALLGLVSCGVSLVLFVKAMRHLGASRAGAYFSVAPFCGAMLAVLLLNEPVTWPLLGAAGLMALGV